MNTIAYRLMSFVMALALAFGINHRALALANTYYVGIAGSDTNAGSSTAPFKTFAKAVSVLAAGDTLQVLAGTYTETLTLSTPGTETAPITVIGDGAVLNMQGVKQNGITISGSYINVSGFEVSGATDFGILVTGRRVTVENNNVHDNVTKNGVGTCGISTAWGSAVKIKVGGENTTIRGNTVYHNCGEGIAVTRGVVAVVENNTTYDNFGVNIYVDNSPFVTVQNNVSYCLGTHLRDGNRAAGIALGEESYSGWGAQLHDILISGNTIRDCRTGIAAFASNVGGTLTNVTISHNNVPSGQIRGISLQTLANQNVLVSNNTLFNSIYVYQTVGVTLVGNVIGSAAPTSTSLASSPTSTMPPPTSTATLAPPSATTTSSPIPASPTATKTASPPTASPSPIPASPTLAVTSVPPTATTIVNTPSDSERIYDDKDSGLIYSAGWQDVTKKPAYGGSYKLTTRNGSSVTFAFTGQSFSVIYKGGPAFRSMDVYVDNILVATINEKASSSGFQLRWDYPGQLAPGNHTLKLVFVTSSTSDATNGSMDAVIVR
jgi:parallel beta helix pectate lyase-like protein/uncharacterized protein DUF1565